MPILPGAGPLPPARPVQGVTRGPVDRVGPAMARAGGNVFSGANDLDNAFEQEQLRIDRTRVEDSHTQLVNFKVDLASGKDGYLTKRGGDAVKTPLLKDSLKRFDNQVKAITDGLDNERQKREFKQHSDVIRGNVTQGVLSHQLREDGTYQKQVLEGTMSAEINSAALSWNVKSEIDQSILRTTKQVDAYADANGLPKEARQAARLEATSDIHAAVIERAINNDQPAYGRKWLNDHRKQIDADTASRLDGLLKVSNTRGNSQSHSDRIWGEGGTPAEMRAKARDISVPEERTMALGLINARIAEAESYVKKDQADALDEMLGYINAREAADHVPVLSDVPVSVVERLSGAGQDTLMRKLNSYSTKPTKASETYYVLEQMHAADEGAFAGIDLNEFDGLITPEEKARFIGYQKDTVTGGPVGEIARSKSQIIKQGMNAAGLDIKKMDTGEKELAFQRRIDAEVEALGRDATPVDFRDIVDRLTIDVLVDEDIIFDDYLPAGRVTIEGIPDNMIDDLAAAVKSSGQTVSVENMQRLYDYEMGKKK